MPGGPNDPLMFDPKTGTSYYASEYTQSYAYYQAIANDPAHQQAIQDARDAVASNAPPAVIDAATAKIDATAKAIPTSIPATHHEVSTGAPGQPPPGTLMPARSNGTKGAFHLDRLYRFVTMIPNPPDGKPFGTGASYPACTRANPQGCQPQGFVDAPSMLAYAQHEGSTLYRVSSADEAFNLIEGKQAIDPSKIITTVDQAQPGVMDWITANWPYVAAGYVVWKLLF